MNKIAFLIIFYLLLLQIGCTQNKPVESPAGYDFSKPVVYTMPDELTEISGIAFKNGNSDTLYGVQDEEGKLFYFHLGDKASNHTRFAKKGDFEDVAICGEYAVLLRSDGVLFTFPLSEIFNKDAVEVNEQGDLLPAGEYEAMYADEQEKMIYIICKNCTGDKKTATVSGYNLKLDDHGKLSSGSAFSLDEAAIAQLSGINNIRLKASALAKNPLTNQWYILSSVNKLLVVTDADWKPLATYHLSPALFTQPEGIAFDKEANLYISNEAGESPAATILQFVHQKK